MDCVITLKSRALITKVPLFPSALSAQLHIQCDQPQLKNDKRGLCDIDGHCFHS